MKRCYNIPMKILEERILKDGIVKDGHILKVGSFLNHQIDPSLLEEMAKEWKRLYADSGVNKILTIEASGIAMGIMAAKEFGCPCVFAKKHKSVNTPDDCYVTMVHSYTHGNDNPVVVARDFLTKDDKVLIIDDFLASGEALKGLIDLCNQANAEVIGCGIAIEKAFQPGGPELRAKGVRIESLARIKSMSGQNAIEFE